MKILKLELKTFKGINYLIIKNTEGNDVVVLGKNGSGKTTIMDAITFLLFGFDSNYNSNFEIKTVDENGKPITKKSEVSAIVQTVNGDVELKRIYSEVRSKGKFTGKHTTTYFIDKEEVKKKDYEASVFSICDEKLFKILSNPLFFNGAPDKQFKWTDRRKIVMDMMADIDFKPIFKKPKYKLLEWDKKQPIEQYLKIKQQELKRLNNAEEAIPVKIQEAKSNIVGLSGKDIYDIETQIKTNEVELEKMRKELSILETKDISLLQQQFTQLEGYISRQRLSLQDKKEEWIKIKNGKAPEGYKCYACGQDLDKSVVKKNNKKFDDEKEQKLKLIVSDGTKIQDDINTSQKSLEGLKCKIDAFIDEKDSAKEEELLGKIKKIQEETNQLNEELFNARKNEEQLTKIADYEQSERQISVEKEKVEHQIYLSKKFIIEKIKLIEAPINKMFHPVNFKLFRIKTDGEPKEVCEITYKGVPYSSLNTGDKLNAGLRVIDVISNAKGVYPPVLIDNRESVTKTLEIKSQRFDFFVDAKKDLTVMIKE